MPPKRVWGFIQCFLSFFIIPHGKFICKEAPLRLETGREILYRLRQHRMIRQEPNGSKTPRTLLRGAALNKSGSYGRVKMKIINTYPALLSAYEGAAFRFEKWRSYIDSALPGISSLLLSDAKECLETGTFSWGKDYLPVLNGVVLNPELRERAYDSFCKTTENLERRVYEKFGRGLDADLIFYLGLCNGAGWVTEYRGQKIVLFGIEKIMELNWCGPDDMRGLIYHELGHIYQGQYGVLNRTFGNDADSFLWQLFTEGAAMCFEQALEENPDYYHQNKDGWKKWCDDHLEEIKADFNRDLKTMTFASQRYFGDWVKYHGHSDVGYYLGCRFVHYILSMYEFDEMICFEAGTVARLFQQFIQS